MHSQYENFYSANQSDMMVCMNFEVVITKVNKRPSITICYLLADM